MQKPDPKAAENATRPDDAAEAVNAPGTQPLGDEIAADRTRSGDVFPQLDTEDTINALMKRPEEGGGHGINAMLNVGLDVQIVLGHTRMPISRLLELTRGSIVELNRKIGAPVDLMVSNRLVARGDLVKVGEDRLGVSLTQIVKDHAPD